MPSPTVEAKARTPLETDGKGHDSGRGKEGYFDEAAVKKWSEQVDADKSTLVGETVVWGREMKRESEAPTVQQPAVKEKDEEEAVWFECA